MHRCTAFLLLLSFGCAEIRWRPHIPYYPGVRQADVGMLSGGAAMHGWRRAVLFRAVYGSLQADLWSTYGIEENPEEERCRREAEEYASRDGAG